MAVSEFIALDEVNLNTTKKVDITEFSQVVRDYLSERRLQNKVFSEKTKKSPCIDAALIGWGIT